MKQQVSKTCVPQGIEGSNPSLSASFLTKKPYFFVLCSENPRRFTPRIVSKYNLVMRKYKTKGYLNGILASVSYGTNPLFALPMLKLGMSVNSILFYRYLFAVIIYGLYLKIFKKQISKYLLRSFIPCFLLPFYLLYPLLRFLRLLNIWIPASPAPCCLSTRCWLR